MTFVPHFLSRINGNLKRMRLYVSIDGDSIGARIGSARLADNVAELKRLNQAIEAGNKLFCNWAINNGGEVVEEGGDEACLEVEAATINDLPSIAKQYYELTGATVSIGVGVKISESSKALLIAKIQGKNQIVFWDPKMDAILEETAKNVKSESAKLQDEYGLAKADGHKSGENPWQSGRMAPGLPHEPVQGGANLDDTGGILSEIDHAAKHRPPAIVAQVPPKVQDFATTMHNYAQQQETADAQPVHDKNQHFQTLRQEVASVLGQVKEQCPILDELQEAAPDTYNAVMALTQAVIDLTRELKDGDPAEAQAFQKSLHPVMYLPKPHSKKRISLPAGTALNGKIKVKHIDGTTSWANVRDGQVLSSDGHSISARYPDTDEANE